MTEIPAHLLSGKAPRGAAPKSHDREPAPKVEPYKPKSSDNVRFNHEIVTPAMVDRLSAMARENIKWRMKSEPYGVQAYALHLAGNRLGFNFFMEQGLGKTLTTLADFWNRYEAGVSKNMLVVTINSMKLTWYKEALEQAYPFDFHVWPDIKNFPDKPEGQVVVINWDAMRSGRGKEWLQGWMDNPKARVFTAFDESTCAANHTSQQGQSAVDLWAWSRGGTRCLAGLPNPNSPAEFYNQLKITGVPTGTIFHAFRNTFCEMGGHRDKVVLGVKNEDRLANMMKGRAFFADKDTWAPTLPDRFYSRRHVEMTPDQKQVYKTMAAELYAEINDETTVSVEQALSKATKLQQISGGWIYDEYRAVHKIGNGEDPKLEAIKDLIKHTPGKILVFAHFIPSVLKLIKAFPGETYALRKGTKNSLDPANAGMTDGELERQKQRFNEDDSIKLFIAPISVMKFGHTLIGSKAVPCTAAVYYENTYSLLAKRQSQDRNHRWGATADRVDYIDIVCSPIDNYILRALERKTDMADALNTALREVING